MKESAIGLIRIRRSRRVSRSVCIVVVSCSVEARICAGLLPLSIWIVSDLRVGDCRILLSETVGKLGVKLLALRSGDRLAGDRLIEGDGRFEIGPRQITVDGLAVGLVSHESLLPTASVEEDGSARGWLWSGCLLQCLLLNFLDF